MYFKGASGQTIKDKIGEIDQAGILLTQEQAASITYYVNKHKSSITTDFFKVFAIGETYQWELRMQARGIGKADPQKVERVYSAPPLAEQTTFDPSRESVVDYSNDKQLFWYKKILRA